MGPQRPLPVDGTPAPRGPPLAGARPGVRLSVWPAASPLLDLLGGFAVTGARGEGLVSHARLCAPLW